MSQEAVQRQETRSAVDERAPKLLDKREWHHQTRAAVTTHRYTGGLASTPLAGSRGAVPTVHTVGPERQRAIHCVMLQDPAQRTTARAHDVGRGRRRSVRVFLCAPVSAYVYDEFIT